METWRHGDMETWRHGDRRRQRETEGDRGRQRETDGDRGRDLTPSRHANPSNTSYLPGPISCASKGR